MYICMLYDKTYSPFAMVGTMASLAISFVNSIGTTKLIETCVEYIRAQDGFNHQGHT